MKCKICEVESQQQYCDACLADKTKIDKHEQRSHKDTVMWLLNMPSHLFFYGLKYLLMDKDSTGKTLNEFLLEAEMGKELYLQPVWLRLKGYRGARGYQGNFDRWDTNPLLVKGAR